MDLIADIKNQYRHIPIKEVILQAGIASKAAKLCADKGKTLLICDENTKDFVKLGGDRVILPANQKPTLTLAEDLAKHQADYFIAVGSGSLNDIVKYASFLAGKPYMVFGTAPSMNGYVSANVSLLDKGYKKSFLAKAPEYVYLDLEILQNAPRRLINSGIGDSICRTTVQADVLLSSQVKQTPTYAELFALMKQHENEIFDDIAALAKTLVYGGLAMLLGGSSAPASGSEHMLAHYMELKQQNAPQSYHGEQIALTTLTMAALQEKLLAEKDSVEITSIDNQKILQHFGEDFGKYCLNETAKKYNPLLGLKINIDKKNIEAAMLGAEIIRQKLFAVGAVTKPSDIGWDEGIYADAVEYSRYTRDRFTFLDWL